MQIIMSKVNKRQKFSSFKGFGPEITDAGMYDEDDNGEIEIEDVTFRSF